MQKKSNNFSGVMLNAYPDSIGNTLSDTINVLKKSEFKDVFSLFYVLPTFFNSDLDRGFSIIDYNLNNSLVSKRDLLALEELNIQLKFDIVLNHLSVASPQFKDLLTHGDKSKYKDFFINWNTFWKDKGTSNDEGVIIPNKEFLSKLFMRKLGLPVLKVPFPDGSEQPYWNTFYQQIIPNKITIKDLEIIPNLPLDTAKIICNRVNKSIENGEDINTINFNDVASFKDDVLLVVRKKCTYLGQMDVNATSELVWDFYEETLEKLKNYGCKIVRLDAFAYLHKEVGLSNFFNTPGTWNYLKRIKNIADKNNLLLLPEIHAEYGLGLHDKVAKEGYYIYDFFLPALMIHTLEKGTNNALLNWVKEIVSKGYNTVNMLGCHDGIPVLDLKGKSVNGIYQKGLLEDAEIDDIMNTILERGGRVKNLYDAVGNKISYYQINATFFSALGECKDKLLLARAIQLFMPGIPQVWYLDLFAGKNNYQAADNGGNAGHKEINRTTLSNKDIEEGLKDNVVIQQLTLMHLRNTSKAFLGGIKINNCKEHLLDIVWQNNADFAQLKANLQNSQFSVNYSTENGIKTIGKLDDEE